MSDRSTSVDFRHERVFRRLLDACTQCVLFSEMPSRVMPEDPEESTTEFNEKEATLFNAVANMLSCFHFECPESVDVYQRMFRRRGPMDGRQFCRLQEKMEMTFETARDEIDLEMNPFLLQGGATAFHKAVIECLLMCTGFLSENFFSVPEIPVRDLLFENVLEAFLKILQENDVPKLLRRAFDTTSNPFGADGLVAVKNVLVMDIYKKNYRNKYMYLKNVK